MPSISLCMIVRDVEDALEGCLASVEKYVDEIVIVDTGSKDKTKEIALAHGAKVFDFNPETHPGSFLPDDERTGAPPPYTGEPILADFSGARNLSFDKATKDFVFWIDSDDIVRGAENLRAIVDELDMMGNGVAWFRYDYSFMNGKPNCQLWRERILRKGNGVWVNPIHEVCTLHPSSLVKYFHNLVIEHRREHLKPRTIAHRNYKVLKRHYEQTKGPGLDARTLFYLANETKFHAIDESLDYYEQYLRSSGWPEERAVARIMMGQLFEVKGDMEAAFRAYSSATHDFPSNPDPFFALARLAYKKNDWNECIRLTEQGFALGSPESAIMYNPLDRNYFPHGYYNVALNSVGRVADASKSCEEGLKVVPDDGNLQFNKKLYDEWLTKNPQAPTRGQVKKSVQFSTDPLEGRPELPPEVAGTFAIQLWKEYLRHDEIVKAKTFLESLPYFLDDSPEITKAKAKTQELLDKVSDDEALKAYYATHEVSEALPVEAPVPQNWSQYPRWSFVKRFLDGKKGLRVLDLGCQDGWLSNRVAMMGHSVVGLDMSDGHLAIARRNAERLNLDATFVNGFIDNHGIVEQFDVVICTEVIEHVVEPKKLLVSLVKLLKRDGTLLLSTPHGAWLRGHHDVMFGTGVPAPKWDEPREHIRAYSISGLRKELETHFNVESCYQAPLPTPDVPGQASLLAVCNGKLGPKADRREVIIWTGPAWEWWGPNSPYEEGTGGSELACVEMAKQLVALGNKVTVYSDCPLRDGLYEGVEYKHFGSMPMEVTCDIFISSRQPQVVLQKKIHAKAKFLWVHDIHIGGDGPGAHSSLLEFDRILCLSEWHKSFFCSFYKWLDPDRVIVTRNGINLERFPLPERSKGNRLIYTSSGNRGLDRLLDIFPLIKERVPDAELDIFYGFNVWRRAAAGNPAELVEFDRFESKMKATAGVVPHGRANQQTLAQAWLRAKVWAYPTSFTETSCISAMEAQAAGAVPVTSNLAALSETVQSGFKFDNPVSIQAYVDTVVEMLTNEEARLVHVRRGREWAELLSWRELAVVWCRMFDAVAEDVLSNPMHSYRSCA